MSKRKNKKSAPRKKRGTAQKNVQCAVTAPPLNIQATLNQASHFFSLGRLADAESLCKKIIDFEPENIPTLYGLGKIAHQTGRLIEAERYLAKIIRLSPDDHEAYHYLGVILVELDRLDDAAQKFQKAAALNPAYTAAHNSLGNLYFSQKKFNLAIDCYKHVVGINPRDSNAHFNLANTYSSKNLFDEAIASFQKALSLQPNNVGALYNMGLTLIDDRRLDDAIQALQTAVKLAPRNTLASDALTNLLNTFMPTIETDCPYVKAQDSLQQISTKHIETHMITDKTVRHLYQQCHDILDRHKLNINISANQLFRGKIFDIDCDRHKMVFNTFNIIPEYCFGCYKVAIEPRTVMELFKLLLVFDKLKLPNDNTRKCTIEKRPGMSGAYKGFIYCKNQNEGKKILNTVRTIVHETISADIPIFIKRGCSEFQLAYPSYGLITNDKHQQMTYNKEWSKYEDQIDKELIPRARNNPNDFTHNHSGFTVRDALVMRHWLGYAAKRGDSSYLDLLRPTLPQSSPHS